MVSCADCGLPYEQMGIDLVLPDQQWRVLFPEERGLLCANCICLRAGRLKEPTVLHAWIDNLDYGRGEEPDMETVDLSMKAIDEGQTTPIQEIIDDLEEER